MNTKLADILVNQARDIQYQIDNDNASGCIDSLRFNVTVAYDNKAAGGVCIRARAVARVTKVYVTSETKLQVEHLNQVREFQAQNRDNGHGECPNCGRQLEAATVPTEINTPLLNPDWDNNRAS